MTRLITRGMKEDNRPKLPYCRRRPTRTLAVGRLLGTFTNIAAAILVSSSLGAQTSAPAPVVTLKLEVEVVTLRDGGFYPDNLTRPAGKFVLVVINRSHATQPQFGITSSSSAAVVAAVEQVLDISKVYPLELAAGTYVLKDSTHPKWGMLTIVTH
jgi:hypothetical protein